LKTTVGVKQESRHTAILIWEFFRNDLKDLRYCITILAESSKLKAESVKNPAYPTGSAFQW
jgi:hypothetical protein